MRYFTPVDIGRLASEVQEMFPSVTRMLDSGNLPTLFNEMIPIDLYETDDGYVVEAELPGMDKNNITLSVEGGVLCIDAEKLDETADAKVKERKYGRFVRTIRMPDDFDEESVGASYKNGVLKVTLKKLTDKSTKIEIQ